jgi:hypothetical protein
MVLSIRATKSGFNTDTELGLVLKSIHNLILIFLVERRKKKQTHQYLHAHCTYK